MLRTAIVAAAAAGGLMAGIATAPAQAAPFTKAETSPGGGIVTEVRRRGGWRGPRGFKGPRFHGPRFHGPRFYGYRPFGPGFHRFYYGAPFAGYGVYAPYYAYRSYDDHCERLRERAEFADSPYWWRRYQACLDD